MKVGDSFHIKGKILSRCEICECFDLGSCYSTKSHHTTICSEMLPRIKGFELLFLVKTGCSPTTGKLTI